MTVTIIRAKMHLIQVFLVRNTGEELVKKTKTVQEGSIKKVATSGSIYSRWPTTLSMILHTYISRLIDFCNILYLYMDFTL